jgi:hypothetical protein
MEARQFGAHCVLIARVCWQPPRARRPNLSFIAGSNTQPRGPYEY